MQKPQLRKTLTVKVLLSLGLEWAEEFPGDRPLQDEIIEVDEVVGHRMIAAHVARVHDPVEEERLHYEGTAIEREMLETRARQQAGQQAANDRFTQFVERETGKNQRKSRAAVATTEAAPTAEPPAGS